MTSPIKAILFDLDGTLYFRESAIPGAIQMINNLRSQGYQLRFLTNTDSRTTEMLQQKVTGYGFEIAVEEIHTPVVAALNYITQHGSPKVFPVVSQEIKKIYEPYCTEDYPVDYVVIGDFRDRVSYELMNQAFRCIDAGAEILALQMGRYYYTKEGKNLDTGSFVTLFEYASGKKAKILGKPSPDFFLTAIKQLGLEPREVAIVGDDLNTDIKGALEIGALGILVKTGKYHDGIVAENPSIQPDYVIDSVAELENVLRQGVPLK